MTLPRTDAIAAIISLLALGACAATSADAPTDANPFGGLGGTKWQLVEIQSMDDGQGVSRPKDPTRYILEFGREGVLSAKLDCNRGKGNWNSYVANANGGSLVIGTMAVTKALCPDPTLGEMLERQLPYVRNFTMSDGRMHMALMADGGIIVWEPLSSK